MAHNLHIFVLNASNIEEAKEKVNQKLTDYGWDWHNLIGVLHQGETESSILKELEMDSMEKINRKVLEWSKPDEHAQKAIDKLKSGFPIDEMDELELHYIAQYANRMRAMKLDKRTCGVGFNILLEELNPLYFEKNGVTHLDYDYHKDIWVVVVDVHE